LIRELQLKKGSSIPSGWTCNECTIWQSKAGNTIINTLL